MPIDRFELLMALLLSIVFKQDIGANYRRVDVKLTINHKTLSNLSRSSYSRADHIFIGKGLANEDDVFKKCLTPNIIQKLFVGVLQNIS